MERFFLNRRSRRTFTGKEVSDSFLTAMLEAASHAPTTGNMQLTSVVVTRTEEGKKRLCPCHYNQPACVNAPVMLTFCADLRRFELWCRQRKAEPGFENFQSLMAAILDTTVFAQQFCTIAEMEGLGTCYLGTTTYNAPEIAEVLGLPERVVPVITVALGYPADEGEDAGRLPVDSVIHFESYKDYTPEDIDAIYAEKEGREDSRKFIAENGKETLAQVFTDIRYPREGAEATSRTFLDLLHKNKFI